MKWWTEPMDGHGASLGILYAEDFGAERAAPGPADDAPPAAPPPSTPTQADIDAACIRAVAAAERAWSAAEERRRVDALEALAASLGQIRQECTARAEATCDGLARTALAVLASALPHYCRAHGDAEVRALLARFMPLANPQMTLLVRVHPGLIEPLAADLASLDDAMLPTIELRPANLPQGDVRLSWGDGSLARDSAAFCRTMIEGLNGLGLCPPTEPLPGSP